MTIDQLELPADAPPVALPAVMRRPEPSGVPAVAAPVAVPSVESILMAAVERGVDAANLERLVALHERVTQQRAVQAFNEALAAFQRDCPPIIKNRDALNKDGRQMYRFADLSEITTIIDPILQRHGLSKKWDTDMVGDLTVTTCTIAHVAGHRESSKFTCKGSGTSLMNAAQVSASAVTFGRRHSLVLALGLTVDEDDDGRRAAPRDKPDADPEQPKVPTRAERQAAGDGSPRVTVEDLNDLAVEWRQATKNPKGTAAEFAAWAKGVLKTDADLTRVGSWTVDSIDAVRGALPE
jgi:hypothetical protein